MTRPPIDIEISVPFAEVDDAFDWWMSEYEKNPDGQFYDIARQLQPHVTAGRYERWRHQFEHPKGTTVVVIRFTGPDGRREGYCEKHDRPIAPGYCE